MRRVARLWLVRARTGHRLTASLKPSSDGAFSSNMSVVATAMQGGLSVVWVVMDNSGFGAIAGIENMHYGSSFGCIFECGGQPYSLDYAAMARACGARGIAIRPAEESPRFARSPRIRTSDRNPSAHGKCSHSDSWSLEHQ
jgi:hypothetical protein